jgi:hypothetical protein
MPYTNIQQMPGSAGGSSMRVGPAGGVGGGGPGGGGDQGLFLELLAQARADKKRREDEAFALQRREMGLREDQALQARLGEAGRRQFAGEELRQRGRGEGQRLALEAAGLKSRLQGEALQRKVGEARHAAMSRQAPKTILESRPGITAGVALPAPHEYTGYQRDIFGAQQSAFTGAGSDAPGGQAWRDDQKRRSEQNAAARG